MAVNQIWLENRENFRMADFAGKLAVVMKSRGLTQTELSRQSTVPQTTLSHYLRRSSRPSWDHVQKLARALGVSCTELMDDLPVVNPKPVPVPPAAKPKGKKK